MRMLDKAAGVIEKALPGCTDKAGQRLAAAAIEYKGIVNDFLPITDALTIRYDALLRKLAVLKVHYGITDETVDDLVFKAREELGRKKFYAFGSPEASKQVTAPI
jgi:hypothetical protein